MNSFAFIDLRSELKTNLLYKKSIIKEVQDYCEKKYVDRIKPVQ